MCELFQSGETSTSCGAALQISGRMSIKIQSNWHLAQRGVRRRRLLQSEFIRGGLFSAKAADGVYWCTQLKVAQIVTELCYQSFAAHGTVTCVCPRPSVNNFTISSSSSLIRSANARQVVKHWCTLGNLLKGVLVGVQAAVKVVLLWRSSWVSFKAGVCQTAPWFLWGF